MSYWNCFVLVNPLFVQFQKSEADLDYIEKRLKLDFINAHHTGDGAPAQVSPRTLTLISPLKIDLYYPSTNCQPNSAE